MKKPPIPHTARGQHLLLCLDYDGTLVPLQKRPELAVMPQSTGALLRELASKPGVTLALVSGRSLKSIKSVAPVRGIVYAGSHGMAITGRGFSSPAGISRKHRKAIACAMKDIAAAIKDIHGAFADEKPLGVALHYRQCAPGTPAKLAKLARATAARYGLLFTKGKKVFELLPPGSRDKGGAVLWIRERLSARTGRKPLTVYIGDDYTDENAFRVLSGEDMGIIVAARRSTAAKYRLPSINAVLDYLAAIAANQNAPS